VTSTPARGAHAARILGLGEHRPSAVVTNDELAATLDTTDEWIRSRVGITSRRIAAPDETVMDMAVAAGGKAIAASGLLPADIGLVIVATCTMETTIPNAAAQVAYRLGIAAPGAFDLNACCAGFCYALAVAADHVRSGTVRHALVIGAEKMSAWVDWTERSTCVLFGDGAGAAVVGPVADPAQPSGIGPVVWGSVGALADKITVPDRASRLRQDGSRVFWWATAELDPIARLACERAGVDPAELAGFVPHQANLRIIEGLAKRIGAPNAVVARDIVDTGNTSAASVPLALSRLLSSGAIPSGGPILLFGFGAGLSYAAQVVIAP
jgi:3-oxoacyl-[acyl-carrier-protein] synthase-3